MSWNDPLQLDESEIGLLRRENELLQRRLDDRTKELEGFMYAVSHDFRGLIRAVLAAGMILQEDYGDRLGDEAAMEFARLSKAGKKMSAMMNELLLLSRLARQEMKREPVDLTDLARSFEIESPAQITLAYVGDLRVIGDLAQLNLVVHQILENAVIYAKPQTVPKVKIGRDGNRIYFADQGIGFDSADAERVFLPFSQLQADGQHDGLGMGLTKVKQIVERHDGWVTIESAPGQGTTVWLTLPLVESV